MLQKKNINNLGISKLFCNQSVFLIHGRPYTLEELFFCVAARELNFSGWSLHGYDLTSEFCIGKRRGDKLSPVSEITSFQLFINQELVWRLDFNHKGDQGVQETQGHAEVMVV